LTILARQSRVAVVLATAAAMVSAAGIFVLRSQLLDHLDVLAAVAVGLTALVAVGFYADIDHFVIGWILLFPLGYYYISFPREKPVLSLDRAVVGILLVAGFFGAVRTHRSLTATMKKAAIAYALFAVAAFCSVRSMENPLGAIKAGADIFVLPAILGYYVISCMDVKKRLPDIHLAACLMVIYVFMIGAAEFVTGHDLMPFAQDVFFGAAGGLKRVNGPFATNNSYGLIGAIALFFLMFLGRSLPIRRGRRLLQYIAIGAAFGVAMMPMFRSMEVTVGLVLLLELFLNKKAAARFVILTLFVAATTGVLWVKVNAPELYEDRISDASNFYARVAQQKQTWRLFLAKPINGVGLGNYPSAAATLGDTSFRGVYSVGSAHNTLGNIFAETGLTGLIPFVLSQIFLCRAFWNLRKRGLPRAALAARFFLYVFLGYWISGLMLTSGYYSDLNFWFVFVIAVLYRVALDADAEDRAVSDIAREFVLSSSARGRRRRGHAPIPAVQHFRPSQW
jgi:O-antigen ligase